MGTRASFSKYLGLETDRLPTSNAKVKNAWNCTFTPLYSFMAWWLITGMLYHFTFIFFFASIIKHWSSRDLCSNSELAFLNKLFTV